jgi:integrase
MGSGSIRATYSPAAARASAISVTNSSDWARGSAASLTAVDRLGHANIQTTQKYLHALAEVDQRNLDALDRMTNRNH